MKLCKPSFEIWEQPAGLEGKVVKRHSGLLDVQELKEFCNE